MEGELFCLELKGRIPIVFPSAVCKWWEDGEYLYIEVQDEELVTSSLGYAQWTKYQVPIYNIKYWGPNRLRNSRPIGYREAARVSTVV